MSDRCRWPNLLSSRSYALGCRCEGCAEWKHRTRETSTGTRPETTTWSDPSLRGDPIRTLANPYGDQDGVRIIRPHLNSRRR